jgi:hypothetical protein
MAASAGQRPKNSHSKSITGIGTPSIHNRIPRPIISSSDAIEKKTRDAVTGSSVEKKPAQRNA